MGSVGVAIGLVLSFAASGLLRTMLYGITATDATTYVTVAGGLAILVLLASWVAAVRAARTEPAVALRSE
jgi:putative ABC transport system permease protein